MRYSELKQERVTLKMLKYFYTVSKCKHFAHAAEVLNISKSPLSAQIKELEDILGGDVFSRNTRNVHLTQLGEALSEECENIFRTLNNSLNKVSRLSREINATINIGIISSFFWAGLAQALRKIGESDSQLNIQIIEMTPEEQKLALRQKRIDLGLSRYADTINIHPLDSQKIFHDDMCVVTSRKHKLHQRHSIALHDLKAERFVMMKRQDSASTQLVEERFANLGHDIYIEKEVFEPHTLMAVVAMSDMISIVPKSFANHQWEDIHFIQLADIIPAHICGIYDPKNTNPRLPEFIRMLSKMISGIH